MFEHIEDKELLRDVYVAIESLRNSYSLLNKHLAEWVALRLSFAEPRGQEWVDQRTALWLALGVEPELAGLLASSLELVWEDGRLRVCGTMGTVWVLVDLLVNALLSLWKFVKFTTGRFFDSGVEQNFGVRVSDWHRGLG